MPLKALVSQINYNLFDLEVTSQQSQFAYLQAKDLADAVDGLLRTHDVALWNGTDTSLSAPTTTQYFGAIGQIEAGGNTVTVAKSTGNIVQTFKDRRRSNGIEFFVPGAADGDLRQPDAARSDRPGDEDGVQRRAEHGRDHGRVPGESTLDSGRRSAADSGVGAGVHGDDRFGAVLPAYIVTEDLIEYHWLTDPNPRVFKLGLPGALTQQQVVVKFGAPVVKGANFAHYEVKVTD